jgi:hypothetical protein
LRVRLRLRVRVVRVRRLRLRLRRRVRLRVLRRSVHRDSRLMRRHRTAAASAA